MSTYITGSAIRQLREAKNMTQAELADRIGVSAKAVSKWETGRGLPDISLLQPLSGALGVSVMELLNGERIANRNISCNVLRSKLYVCPICGNVIHSTGSAAISCCGILLPPLEAEEMDESHSLTVENVEDEQYLTIRHPMTKEHYISFAALVTSDRFQLVKFYPEGDAAVRMRLRGHSILYFYCNRHGLFQKAL